MIDPLTTMGFSTVAGFAFKLVANWQEDKAKSHQMLIDRTKSTDDSMDKANNRGNVWMRRFVVFSMISLFVFVSIGVTEPTNIVKEISGDSFLWGLIQLKPETIVIPVNGTIRDDALVTSVLTIITFLFGVDVAERKH